MHIAASSGNLAFIIYAYEKLGGGQDLSLRDDDGFIPFLSAAHASQVTVLAKLFDLLPPNDTKSTTNQGFSALHLACRSGSISAVKYLLDKGMDVAATSKDGSTALHCTMVSDSDDRPFIIEALLNSNAKRSDRG